MADLLIARTFWRAYALVYDLIWDNGLMDVIVDEVVVRVGVGARVVEVGAGTGLATVRLVDRGVDVVASEPDRSMRKRFLRRLDVPIHGWAIEEIERLPNTRDVVVAVNVLHTTPEPAAALAQLRASVGARGRVVVVVPAADVRLRSVGRAQRQAGSTRRDVARFLALHAGLAPLTALARAGVSRPHLRQLADAPATQRASVLGVCHVLTFGGTADRL